MKQRASRPKQVLRCPDLRLVQRQTGPNSLLDVTYLLLPLSQRGRGWLEAHADGRQWLEGALVIEPAIYTQDSLLAKASSDGLARTGWGPVCGAMLYEVRINSAPELTLSQLAARLGFTVEEWELMENDERLIPKPDPFWDRAMRLMEELQRKRDGRASAAESN